MAGPLAEAAVEIVAEFGDFDEEVRRHIRDTIDDAARAIESDLADISAAASRAGDSLGESLGDGFDEASRSAERLTTITREAERAFNDLDAAQLRAIAQEAQQATAEMEELGRAAIAGEGAFASLSDEQLQDIARAAAEGQREMARLAISADAASASISQFSSEGGLRDIARDAERAQRSMEDLDRTGLARVASNARLAATAIAAAFTGASRRSQEALAEIDDERFDRVTVRAIAAANRIRRAFNDVDSKSFGRSIAGIAKGLGGLVAGAGAVAALGIATASATNAILALGAALAPTVGILAALPATALLGAAAFGTLALGLHGVGDAFKAVFGPAEKFNEAIKNMAPAAQAVFKEIRALKPQFDALTKSVQDALFKPLVGDLKDVAKNLSGPVKKGATQAAAQFGRLASAVADFGKSAESASLVTDVFASLNKTLKGIKSDSVSGLFDALSRFTRATLPAFDGLGGSLDATINRFSDFLDRARESGDALSWVQNAVAAFRSLGRILADVGSVTAGVFRAAQAVGGDLLSRIEENTQAAREFVNSAQGQSSLTEIFRALAELGGQLIPIVKALVNGLADLSPTIADLGNIAGPALATAITAIADGLKDLGPGLVNVFENLSDAITNIADSNALETFASGVSDLLSALAPLIPVLGDAFVGALRVVGVALTVISPLIRIVTEALKLLANVPVIGPALTTALGAVTVGLIAVRLATGSWSKTLVVLRAAVAQAIPFITRMGVALRAAVVANPIAAIIIGIAAAVIFIATRFQAVRDRIAAVGDALKQAVTDFKEFIGSVRDAFSEGGIEAAVRRIGDGILNGFRFALDRVIAFVKDHLKLLLFLFAPLPVQIGILVAKFGPRLLRIFVDGLQSIAAAIPGLIARIGAAFGRLGDIVGQIRDSLTQRFNELAATLPARITEIGNRLTAAIPRLVTQVSAAITRAAASIGKEAPKVLEGAAAGVQSQATTGSGGLIDSFVNLIKAVAGALVAQIPTLGPVVLQAVLTLIDVTTQAIADNAPRIALALVTALGTIAVALSQAAGTATANLTIAVVRGLISLGLQLNGALARAFARALPAIVSGINRLVREFALLPFRVIGALAALGILLAALMTRAMNAFNSAASRVFGNVLAFFRTIPGRVIAAVVSLAARLAAFGSQIMARFRSGASSGSGGLIGFFRSLPGRIIGALGGLVSQMASLGASVMQGFISGVQSFAGSIVDAVTAPIRSAINIAESLIKPGSPSKVFTALGKSVGEGFVKGVKSQQAAIQATFSKIFLTFVKGATGTVASINSAFNRLFSSIITTFKGKRTKVDDVLIQSLRATNAQLVTLAKQRDAIAATIKRANETATSVTQGARDFASLTGAAGDTTATTPAALAAALRNRLGQLKQFAADVATLGRRGVSKGLLQQIIDAGPEQGRQLAAGLAGASSAAIAEFNALNTEINTVSSRLGKDSADLLFDAGKKAGQGFLTGLKAQETQILAFMESLAKKAANAVKRTLKIKSPSQVFEAIGADTARGFANGLSDADVDTAFAALVRDLVAEFQAAAAQLTNAVAAGRNLPGTASPLATATQNGTVERTSKTATTTNNREVIVTQNFNITTPVDPEELARLVSKRVVDQVR